MSTLPAEISSSERIESAEHDVIKEAEAERRRMARIAAIATSSASSA
jgi:hypothetical protein